jgi:hypothetical protein
VFSEDVVVEQKSVASVSAAEARNIRSLATGIRGGSLPVLANAAPETINSKAIEVATALIDKRISGGFSGPPDLMHGSCHQDSCTTFTGHAYVVVNK